MASTGPGKKQIGIILLVVGAIVVIVALMMIKTMTVAHSAKFEPRTFVFRHYTLHNHATSPASLSQVSGRRV